MGRRTSYRWGFTLFWLSIASVIPARQLLPNPTDDTVFYALMIVALIGVSIVLGTAVRRALLIRRVRDAERRNGGISMTPDWPDRRRFWRFTAWYTVVVCATFTLSREYLPYWLDREVRIFCRLATLPTSLSFDWWTDPLWRTSADPVLPAGVPRLLLYLGVAAMALMNAALTRYVVLAVRWTLPPYNFRRGGD